MQDILNGLAEVLGMALRLYTYVVFIAVILNLVNADPGNGLVRMIRSMTEPLFALIRRRLPFVVVGGLDLSPLVVYAMIIFLERALVGNLYRLAQ